MFDKNGGANNMSAKEELLSFVANLTPEQVEKIINRFPELISALAEQGQPCHPGQTDKIA
jgi:hypothetical protein